MSAVAGESVLASAPRTTGADRLPWPLEASDSTRTDPDPFVIVLPPPSARFARHTDPRGYFSIDRPAEWQVFDSTLGLGVLFAPIGGIITRPNGARDVAEGFIVNHYAPFDGDMARAKLSARQHFAPLTRVDGRRGSLEDATDDLVRTIIWTRPHLAAPNGSARAHNFGGDSAYTVLLTGLSPWTGQEECVVVFTRAVEGGHVVYALGIAQKRNFEIVRLAFDQMMESLDVNEAAVHRVDSPAPFRSR
jgi:hypothetical protein